MIILLKFKKIIQGIHWLSPFVHAIQFNFRKIVPEIGIFVETEKYN